MNRIAVLIPCFNEALTIRKVVEDFRAALPQAAIYVYDNATQKLYFVDQELVGMTEELHGETSFSLPRQGKDITVLFADGTQKTLAWNGKGFTLKEK